MLSLKRSTGKYCNLPRPSRTLSLTLFLSCVNCSGRWFLCDMWQVFFCYDNKDNSWTYQWCLLQTDKKGLSPEMFFLISKQWFFTENMLQYCLIFPSQGWVWKCILEKVFCVQKIAILIEPIAFDLLKEVFRSILQMNVAKFTSFSFFSRG